MRILGKHRQIFLFSLSFYFLTACSQNQPVNQVITSQCPTRPTAVLETNNVKPISLGSQAMKETGMVTNNKSLGYTFTAKSGDKLVYKTNQDICIWVYTPDNQLINSPILPLDGKYTVQVAAMGGSTTFDLGLELEDNNTQAVNLLSSPIPTPVETTQASIISNSKTTLTRKKRNLSTVPAADIDNRPSPEILINDYYTKLNQNNYAEAWSFLATELQENSTSHPNGYQSYIEWWEQVNNIDVQVISSSFQNKTAKVKVRCKNDLKNGSKIYANILYYLRWNETDDNWRIINIQAISSATTSNLSVNESQPTSSVSDNVNRPSPAKAIEDYYNKINNQQYQTAWDIYPTTVKENKELHPDGYNSFIEWWTQVDHVNINRVKIEEENYDNAIVNISTRYKMKSGKLSPIKLKFYLAWNKEDQRWYVTKIKHK